MVGVPGYWLLSFLFVSFTEPHMCIDHSGFTGTQSRRVSSRWISALGSVSGPLGKGSSSFTKTLILGWALLKFVVTLGQFSFSGIPRASALTSRVGKHCLSSQASGEVMGFVCLFVFRQSIWWLSLQCEVIFSYVPLSSMSPCCQWPFQSVTSKMTTRDLFDVLYNLFEWNIADSTIHDGSFLLPT